MEAISNELTLHEGQRLTGIHMHLRHTCRFANIPGRIINDFAEAGMKVD